MEEFAAKCCPLLLAGALLALPQLSDWLCSIIWAKCNCPGKNMCLSCPPAGMSLVMLQGITAFFSHEQSCALCVSAGTRGMGQVMDREKEEEGSSGPSAQEFIWLVCMDLLIFGVDDVQYESSIFFLYPDWWLKCQKLTEQRVWIKLELYSKFHVTSLLWKKLGFFSISEHFYKHFMKTVSLQSPYESINFQMYLLPELNLHACVLLSSSLMSVGLLLIHAQREFGAFSSTVLLQVVDVMWITNVISSSASCVMGSYEQMAWKASRSSLAPFFFLDTCICSGPFPHGVTDTDLVPVWLKV